MVIRNQEPKLLISFNSTELLLGICPSEIIQKNNKKETEDALLGDSNKFLHPTLQDRRIMEN